MIILALDPYCVNDVMRARGFPLADGASLDDALQELMNDSTNGDPAVKNGDIWWWVGTMRSWDWPRYFNRFMTSSVDSFGGHAALGTQELEGVNTALTQTLGLSSGLNSTRIVAKTVPLHSLDTSDIAGDYFGYENDVSGTPNVSSVIKIGNDGTGVFSNYSLSFHISHQESVDGKQIFLAFVDTTWATSHINEYVSFSSMKYWCISFVVYEDKSLRWVNSYLGNVGNETGLSEFYSTPSYPDTTMNHPHYINIQKSTQHYTKM